LGQVAIETSLAIVAIFIFLLGVTQIFLWMNRSMVERQRAYQTSRTQLGSAARRHGKIGSIDFYQVQDYPNKRLYVFPEENPRRR
jgi:hypothetical protein